MKIKFVFISLLFCCFITQLEAQEDQIRKNQVGLVSSFLFSDSDAGLLYETECPLSFYYQRTFSPRVSLGFRMGFIRTYSSRNVYHLFSRVSVYSSNRFNAYIKPVFSFGQYENTPNYYSNIDAESFIGSALDIGCRFITLKGRFNILFEKEFFNYTTFQMADDEDILNYFDTNSFLEGIRLGVEMGF